MRVTTNSFVLMLATPWVRRPRAHVAHRALARRDLASQGRRNRLRTVIHHTSPEANRPHNLRVVNLQRPLLLFCSCGTDLAVRLRLSPALRLRSLYIAGARASCSCGWRHQIRHTWSSTCNAATYFFDVSLEMYISASL